MSVREIAEHLTELYGTEIRRDTISRVTDAVLEEIPVRIPYPEEEELYNPENFAPYAGTEITEPLWWMQ